MVKSAGLAQNFYVHGADLSGDVGSIDNAGSPRNTLEVTGLDKSAVERIMLYGNGEMTWNNWFNDASGQSHPILAALPTTDIVVVWALGLAIGDAAAFMVAKQVNYDPTGGDDGSLSSTAQALCNGSPLEWGTMLTAGLITHSTATNATSEDNGASTASGLAGVLEVKSIAGGTITLTIEDSTNNSSFSTLKAFTNVSSAPTAERVTVSGTVNRYLRIASSGSFSATVFAVATRRGTAQDDEAYA